MITLAVIEGLSLFGTVYGMILFWKDPIVVDWIDVAQIAGRAAVVTVCCMIAFYYNDLYDLRKVDSVRACAGRLLQSFGVSFILLAVFYETFPDTRIGRRPFVSSFVVMAGFLLVLRAVSYLAMRQHPFTERVLLLGTSPLAFQLVDELASQRNPRISIVGVVADDPLPGWLPALVAVHPLDAIRTAIAKLQPDRILVTMTERRGRLPFRDLLDAKASGIPVEDAAAMYERLTGKLAIDTLTPSYLIFSNDFRKSRVVSMAGRLVSLVLSTLALIVLVPVIALVVIAIKLDSRGPILVVQERVGMAGKRFRLVKFRTMHPVSHESSMWFEDNCDRITRIGQWLRRFRLDEVPQLLSVIRGDMNLVGPRPHRVLKFEAFASQIPYFSLRSVVRPGLTGWAQVRHGYASDLDEEIEKVRYDLYYIKHQSLQLDIQIMFDTVKILLFGRGSGVRVRPAAERVAASRARTVPTR